MPLAEISWNDNWEPEQVIATLVALEKHYRSETYCLNPAGNVSSIRADQELAGGNCANVTPHAIRCNQGQAGIHIDMPSRYPQAFAGEVNYLLRTVKDQDTVWRIRMYGVARGSLIGQNKKDQIFSCARVSELWTA